MVKRGEASKAVREYLAAHPDERPKDVANALKKYNVTPNLVSNIKSRIKHGSDRISIVEGRAIYTGNGHTSTHQLRAAAEFIRRCGGVSDARATLELAAEIAMAATD